MIRFICNIIFQKYFVNEKVENILNELMKIIFRKIYIELT